MKGNELSEQESLALITQMIANAQANLKAKIDGRMFLLWGYVSVIIAVAIWIMNFYFSISQASWLWFLVPVVCFPMNAYQAGKSPVAVKSYIDRIISAVMYIFTLGFILTALPTSWIIYEVFFFESMLFALMTMILGAILRNNIIIGGGVTGLFPTMGFLVIPKEYELLLFAFIIIIMFIIPGHLFKRSTK